MLTSYFNKFLCHYSDEVMKYGHNIPDLLQFCMDFDTSHHASLHTDLCPAFSDVFTLDCTHHANTSQTDNISFVSRNSGPIPLANLRNTCYINCVLQVLFHIGNIYSFECWNNHIMHINEDFNSECVEVLIFVKFLELCKLQEITRDDLVNFMDTLYQYDPFFNSDVQRDAHEAFTLMLDIFNKVCRKPKSGSEFSDIPEFMDYYFCGIFQKKFKCTACHEDNIFFNTSVTLPFNLRKMLPFSWENNVLNINL